MKQKFVVFFNRWHLNMIVSHVKVCPIYKDGTIVKNIVHKLLTEFRNENFYLEDRRFWLAYRCSWPNWNAWILPIPLFFFKCRVLDCLFDDWIVLKPTTTRIILKWICQFVNLLLHNAKINWNTSINILVLFKISIQKKTISHFVNVFLSLWLWQTW